MPGFELRVWRWANRTKSPDRVVPFDADTEVTAVQRMTDYAATLPEGEDVWLFEAGAPAGRSLASAGGRR